MPGTGADGYWWNMPASENVCQLAFSDIEAPEVKQAYTGSDPTAWTRPLTLPYYSSTYWPIGEIISWR